MHLGWFLITQDMGMESAIMPVPEEGEPQEFEGSGHSESGLDLEKNAGQSEKNSLREELDGSLAGAFPENPSKDFLKLWAWVINMIDMPQEEIDTESMRMKILTALDIIFREQGWNSLDSLGIEATLPQELAKKGFRIKIPRMGE